MARPRADAPNKPPKPRREIEVMKTSPVDLSFVIPDKGVAKKRPRLSSHIEKTILIIEIQLKSYI
jgi:hypothetical protein